MCVCANLECFRVQQQVVVAYSGSNQPNKAEEKADDDDDGGAEDVWGNTSPAVDFQFNPHKSM
jgi:hypothetical protein